MSDEQKAPQATGPKRNKDGLEGGKRLTPAEQQVYFAKKRASRKK